MSRAVALALAALAVGVGVAVVALGGDDDDGTTAGGGTSTQAAPGYPGGPQGKGPPGRGSGPGAARDDGGSEPAGVGEQHATSFDETMRGVAYPAVITAGARDAVLAVEETLGPETTPGQQTVVAADCPEGVCVIRYRSGYRGTGAILEGQQEILRRLFARPLRRVVLLVHHKSSRQTKEERPVFVTTDCTRADHPDLDWAQIEARDIPKRCDFAAGSGGKIRNLVRRGNVSVAEASLGGVDPKSLPGQ